MLGKESEYVLNVISGAVGSVYKHALSSRCTGSHQHRERAEFLSEVQENLLKYQNDSRTVIALKPDIRALRVCPRVVNVNHLQRL